MLYLIIMSFSAYVLYKAAKSEYKNGETTPEKIIHSFLAIGGSLKRAWQRLKRDVEASQQQASKKLSKEEAYAILGLTKEASADDINKAFKRLMILNHPDKGGSKYLASKILEARECLTARDKKSNKK